MAAKCNISKFALEYLNKYLYGFTCQFNYDMILENYLEYLDCDTIRYNVCFPDDCSTPPVTVLTCDDFKINKITYNSEIGGEEEPDDVTLHHYFSVEPGDYVGGNPPFQYTWTYDTNVYDIIGTVNDPILHLVRKDYIYAPVTITKIFVEIVDLLGCEANKACYIVGEDLLECAEDYVLCPNPASLEVVGESV